LKKDSKVSADTGEVISEDGRGEETTTTTLLQVDPLYFGNLQESSNNQEESKMKISSASSGGTDIQVCEDFLEILGVIVEFYCEML